MATTKDLEISERVTEIDGDGSRSSQDEFVLEQVLGLTSNSAHALSLNTCTGQVAFPAACMLVLLDPKTNEQKFIESPTLRYISSVNVSEDGRLLAFGEHGFKPYVLVWLTREHREYSRFVVDNSVGIKAIHFHPKASFMVILGCSDLNIGVWDFVRGRRLALTKWQTSPLGLTIPRPGTHVAVCGHRKVTLFKIDSVQSNMHETNVFQERKAVLLGRQSEYTFVDICSGRNRHEKEVYTVTSCGFLCEIKMGDIIIDKAIKVDAHAYCVRYGVGHIFVGCCNGMVKICNPETLNVEAVVSISLLLGSEGVMKLGAKNYPDTTAMVVNERDAIVTCIYADYTVHSWQFSQVGDKMVCSAIVPTSKYSQGGGSYETCIKDQFEREALLRSFLGFSERVKGSKIYDLPSANDTNGAQQYVKTHKTRYQHANAIKFSPDGKEVVCGNEEGEIKVYDAATGVLRRVIEAHSSHVTCIDLMYDDEYRLVCSGGRDRIIFVLNAKTDFSLVQVLCDHSAAITAVNLVHNSGLLTLVSAAADNVILIRRAIPGNTLKFTITGEIAEAAHNKSFNVTSEYIVTGAVNGGIKLWKADPVFSGKPTKTIKCEQKGSTGSRAIGIDPSGSFMAVTQSPGQITVYHMQTGQAVGSLTSQSDVTSVKFTNDLRYMISSTSNGCALVWRLPERMTEFMRSKQEKTYQVEMAREISYETYVSCLRVCNETSYEDTPRNVDTDSSSECPELDLTPSIESMSLLRLCPELEGSSHADDTATTSVSYLSCSTCHESCSDTVYPTTDSTAPRFPAVDGRKVEENTCTRLGMFKYVSTIEGNELPDRFTFKSRSSKNQLQSAGDTAGESTYVNFSKNNGKVNAVETTKLASLYNENLKTDNIDPCVQSCDGATSKIYNLSSEKDNVCPLDVRSAKCRMSAVTLSSPTKCTRQTTALSTTSEMTYETPNSLLTTGSSYTKDYGSLFSPMLMSSAEMDYYNNCTTSTTSRCHNSSSTNYMISDVNESDQKSKQRSAAVNAQNDTCAKKDASNENCYQTKTCSKDNIHSAAVINVEVMIVKPETETVVTHSPLSGNVEKENDKESGKRKDEEVYCNSVDNFESKLDKKSPGVSPRKESGDVCISEKKISTQLELSVDAKHAKRKSTFDEEELKETMPKCKSNTHNLKSSGTQDKEQEIACSETNNYGCLADNSRLDHSESVNHVTSSSEVGNGDTADGGRKSVTFDSIEDGTVFNYNCITRDEHGRLRWLGQQVKADASVTSDLARNRDSSPETKPTTSHCHIDSLWNIKCSRCTNKSHMSHSSPNKSSLNLLECKDSLASCKDESEASHTIYLESNTAADDDQKLGYQDDEQTLIADDLDSADQQKNAKDACDLLMNPSQFMEKNMRWSKEYIKEALSKWHCELRQCLQLSNSQETFYRLYSDIDDTELIELLTLALDTRPAENVEATNSQEEEEDEEKTIVANGQASCEKNTSETLPKAAVARLHQILKKTVNADKSPRASTVQHPPNKDGENFSLQEFMSFLEKALNERKAMKPSPPPKLQEDWPDGQNRSTKLKVGGFQKVFSSETPARYRESQEGLNFISRLQQGLGQGVTCGRDTKLDGDQSEELLDMLARRARRIESPTKMDESAFFKAAVSDSKENESKVWRRFSDSPREGSSNRTTGDLLAVKNGLLCMASNDPGQDSQVKVQCGQKYSPLDITESKTDEDSQSRSSEMTDNGSSLDKSDGQQQQDESGSDQRSDQEAESGNEVSKQSIVDMFRDQDEYLRKLKEVREKFEESIRALSNERKFRRAKTDSTS